VERAEARHGVRRADDAAQLQMHVAVRADPDSHDLPVGRRCGSQHQREWSTGLRRELDSAHRGQATDKDFEQALRVADFLETLVVRGQGAAPSRHTADLRIRRVYRRDLHERAEAWRGRSR